MKLLSYLMSANVPTLKTIATRVGHFTPENSKQRLASGIIHKLTRSSELEEIVAELTDHGHSLLQFMTLRPKDSWRIGDFGCFREVWSEPEIHQGLSELVNTGLIGVVYEQGADADVFNTFIELQSLLEDLLATEEPEPVEADLEPETVHSYPEVWIADLMTLVGYIQNNGLQVTKMGVPHGRDAKCLEPLLLGGKIRDLFERFGAAPWDWRENLFRVLDRAAVALVENARARLAEDAAERIEKQILAKEADPFDALKLGREDNRYENDIRAICRIAVEARETEPVWKRVEALEAALYPTPEVFPSGTYPRVARAVLFELMTLGVVELGEGDDGWFWRSASTASEAEKQIQLHVQPNFEIVAATSVPALDRLALERIADLEAIDHQLVHYKITKDSVYRGLCLGWSSEKQVDWYNDRMGGGRALPQNVAHSLESWGAAYGRVSLEHPLLLVCESPTLAEELYHSHEVASYCLGRFSESALLIRADAEAEVLTALGQMGLLPNPKVGSGLRWAIETKDE